MKLPVLFLGHGSPMNAITDTPYSREWQKLGNAIRRTYGDGLKAVLAVSAHWCTSGSAVTAMTNPRTIHDFGGFPQALFDVQYPAVGSPALAQQIRLLLGQDVVAADETWGLDHGAWSVLCHLFPQADVPVVQLSLNVRLDFTGHVALGRKLAALREQGVLIVASGGIIHNLRTFDWQAQDEAGGYEWAVHVQHFVNRLLEDGDTAMLSDECTYPPEFQSAAPTPEHFWPLLYAAAAAEGEPVHIFNDEIVGKSLSMTSAVWGMAAW